jgi:5-methylcytosine-specific restriction protein A
MTTFIQGPCRGFNEQKPCDKHTLPGSQYCADHQRVEQVAQQEEDSSRYKKNPHRRMYDKASWRRLRHTILARDPICVQCIADKVPRPLPSTVADHITDHQGDPALFFDPANLRGVCKDHHDKKTGSTRGFGSKERKPHAPTCVVRQGMGFCSCGVGYDPKVDK